MSHPSIGNLTGTGGFARHHWTSLALAILGTGAAFFIFLSHEVMEGETLRFDRSLLLALRTPGAPDDPLGPAWVEEMFRDFTALGGVGVMILLTLTSFG
jgi:undecaprenyl-diphosphatase